MELHALTAAARSYTLLLLAYAMHLLRAQWRTATSQGMNAVIYKRQQDDKTHTLAALLFYYTNVDDEDNPLNFMKGPLVD